MDYGTEYKAIDICTDTKASLIEQCTDYYASALRRYLGPGVHIDSKSREKWQLSHTYI